ncbi:uncharacterized protein LOC106177341 [Lingula anatina]|uniref:Uncharacterized protein LOC106177341 n=1 Tax=Lingula anatina TaxID=7574 RepID=A0A1S3JZS7_LINAN|nr:uncharacterized protein LOC106177341 [Lingula anatina]|eukprot:XP_013415536.2 uncharacterized protein LOC106177341 [Lingula anatina]
MRLFWRPPVGPLAKRGFHNLHAFDMSSKMLDVAKQKNIYKKLMCIRLGPEGLDIPDDTYDAVMMTGAAGLAHIGGDCLGEFIRIVKPGGYVVMDTILKHLVGIEYNGRSWDETLDDFLMAGRWVTVTRRQIENSFNTNEGMQYAFRVK